MTSILFLMERIYSNILRSNYLRNKTFFPIFLGFPKFRFNFENFRKKDDPHDWCSFELTDSEKPG